MKILLDSVWYFINRWEDRARQEQLFDCLHYHQFLDLLEILFTKSQMEEYIGDNQTIFTVSDKNIQAGKEFMKNNIWNEK